MFEDYTVKEYFHKRDKRWMVDLYNQNTQHRITMTRARYMMTVHLGRALDPKLETVDHINGDKTDDRIENFQLLSSGDNSRKSKIGTGGKNLISEICPTCNNEFKKPKNSTKKFCSKKCVKRK